MLGVDLLLFPDSIASTTPKDSSSFLQSTRDLLLPGWAERIVRLLGLRKSRLFFDRAEQPVQHYPHEGFHAEQLFISSLVTVCPGIHLLYIGDIVALGSLISIYFLFGAISKLKLRAIYSIPSSLSEREVFFSPQLTILSMLWLLEAYRFQSLTPRRFLRRALSDGCCPYWMLFGHAFFYNEMELFYRPFNQLLAFGEVFNLQILQPWELAILGYLLVMFIVSAVHCIAAGFEDKIRTRAYLQFLIDLTLFLFLLIALATDILQCPAAFAYHKQQHPDRTFLCTDQ